MLEFRRVEKKSSFFQILQDRFIRVFTESSGPGRLLCHLALFIYQLYKRQTVMSSHIGVVLTECRRDVYHAGTVRQRDIGVAGYIICFFLWTYKGEQRFILFILQILPHISFQYFIGRLILCGKLAQHCIQQSLGHIIGISVRRFHFHISFRRIYTKRHVGRKRPGRSGPRQDIRILIFYLKTDNGRTFFDVLISLSHLMAGQRSTASGTVGYDFISFI